MNDTNCNIIEQLCVFGEQDKEGKWTKELNIVSWYGNEPVFDLRSWDPFHNKSTKGVTLTKGEARKLQQTLNNYLS